MKAVTTHLVGYIKFLWQSITEGMRRNTLVKCGIKNRYLGHIRGSLQSDFYAEKVGGVVQRCERNQLSDWFLANQLMKSKKTIAFLESWQDADSPIKSRLFWYHQARLRWRGQRPHDNTLDLLASLERDLETAEPAVQWAMNFCAAWIGIYEPELRGRCVELGEKLGLYSDEKPVKGCTPNYLPEFIRIEVAKREA